MEDEAIIALFFARSEQAIAELDGKYGKICRGLAQRILNDQRDAEECVSDAYFGTWNAIPPAHPDPLLPFVCRILRNRAIARYHANAAQKRNSEYDLSLSELEEVVPDTASAEDAVLAGELTRLVEEYLRTLKTPDRVLFLRRYYYAEPYETIARRLGLSPKNVSVRLSRVRAGLRRYLKEKEIIP